MTTITISLPESLKESVDGQVSDKGYENASEYLGCLLREAQEPEREARLEQLMRDGLTSGEDISVDGSFWTDVCGEAVQMVEKRTKHR